MATKTVTHGHDRSHLLIFAMACYVSVPVIILAVSANPRSTIAQSPAAASALVVLLFFALLAAMHALARRSSWTAARSTALLHPPILMTWFAAVMFAAPAVYGISHPYTLTSLYSRVPLDVTYVGWGLVLMLVGCGVLFVGYVLAISFIPALPFAPALGTRRVAFGAVRLAFLAVLGVQLFDLAVSGVAYAADVNAGGLSAIANWLNALKGSMPLILALLLRGAIQEGWSRRAVAGAWLSQIGLGAISGFSGGLMSLLLVFAVTAVASGVRPRALLAPGVVGAVLIGAVIPVTEGIRTQTLEGRFSGAVADAPIAAITAFNESWGSGFGASWEVARYKMISRQAGTAMSPGIIMSSTPGYVAFQGSDQFVAIPLYIVPRAVWPSKPVLSTGRALSYTYLGYDSSTLNSSAPTLFGDLYTFSGWPSVVLGCLLLGGLLGVIAHNTLGAGNAVVLIALFPLIAKIESPYAQLVIGIVQQTIVLFAAYWALTRLSARGRS